MLGHSSMLLQQLGLSNKLLKLTVETKDFAEVICMGKYTERLNQ